MNSRLHNKIHIIDPLTPKKYEFVEFQNLKQSISKEVLTKFLESSKS